MVSGDVWNKGDVTEDTKDVMVSVAGPDGEVDFTGGT